MDHIHMLSNAIRLIFLKSEFKMDKKIASKGILGNKLNFIGLVLPYLSTGVTKIFCHNSDEMDGM